MAETRHRDSVLRWRSAKRIVSSTARTASLVARRLPISGKQSVAITAVVKSHGVNCDHRGARLTSQLRDWEVMTTRARASASKDGLQNTRIDLAAALRLIHLLGLDGASTTKSRSAPGAHDRFLIISEEGCRAEAVRQRKSPFHESSRSTPSPRHQKQAISSGPPWRVTDFKSQAWRSVDLRNPLRQVECGHEHSEKEDRKIRSCTQK